MDKVEYRIRADEIKALIGEGRFAEAVKIADTIDWKRVKSVYSLCELAIKMGEFVHAVEYYKEFVRIAPRDTGRYILQYKLYEAQEVSLE